MQDVEPTSLAGKTSLWAPLSSPLFRLAAIAACLSFMGTFITEFSAIWVLTTLTARADLIALAQSAAYACLMVLAIPCGVLSKAYDRRGLLLARHLSYLVLLVTFLLFCRSDQRETGVVITLIFLFGANAASTASVWQVFAPDLAHTRHTGQAVTLFLTIYNLSRLCGPAIGGLVMMAAGPIATLSLVAGLFALTAILLVKLPRPAETRTRGRRTVQAFREAASYILQSRNLQLLSLCSLLYACLGSVIWALLPTISRTRLDGMPITFGLLTSSLGLGSLLIAHFIPVLLRHFHARSLLRSALVGLSVGGLLLDQASTVARACLACLWIGSCWFIGVTIFGIVARQIAPSADRAEAVTVYLVAFSLGMTVGGSGWGSIAEQFGQRTAIVTGAILLLIGAFTTIRLLPHASVHREETR